MVATVRLILVRHGETQLNKEGQVQGLNVVPLNATGQAQARAVALVLSKERPSHLYSSPLVRAVETAEIAAESLRISPISEDGFREADVGELDGMTMEEIKTKYPRFLERWNKDCGRTRMPGGVSLLQVQNRTWPVIETLRYRHPYETVVVVTHNFVMHTIVCKILGMPLDRCRSLQQDLGSLTRIEITEKGAKLLSLYKFRQ